MRASFSAELKEPYSPPFSAYYAPILLLVGMILRIWLIAHWPIIFGGDTILRMANREHVLLSYQLPGLQAVLHYLTKISESPALARYAMALIGSTAGLGFYCLASHYIEQEHAFYAGLFFVTNPFLLALSTVPYQEILMLAGLFFGFHFFFTGNLPAASLTLGLACLTRYEAWAACPVLVLAHAVEKRWRLIEVVKALLLYGWAPLAWIVYRSGFSPSGTFVVDTAFTPWRFMRYVQLGWVTLKNTPLPVVFLAGMGAVTVWKAQIWKQRRMLLLMAFLLLFLLAILFSAHGERPDPDRQVTPREAHLLICGVLLLAGFGLSPFTRWRRVLLVLSLVFGVYGAGRYMARVTSPANLQLSYELAQYFDRTLQKNERAIVLTKPIPQPLIQDYLDKALQTGGAKGLASAWSVLRSMDTSPPDYQRTLVHSHVGKQRLLSFGSIVNSQLKESEWPDTRAQWVAVWSDFSPGNALEKRIYERMVQGRLPSHIVTSGDLSVSVYHTGEQ